MVHKGMEHEGPAQGQGFFMAINPCLLHMCQSRVEIEGYSIAYFNRIAAFEAPYR